MEAQIKIATPRKKSNIELLIDRIFFGDLRSQLGSEEIHRLRSSIEEAALLDAADIRKEANVAVVKLSAALETTTRLLADAQERLDESSQMIADLYRKTPEA